MGVRVISCFDRTSANAVSEDNKSFRICIIDADKEKFLSGDNWSVGISIQKWIFKPKVVSDQNYTTGVNAPRGGDKQSTRTGSSAGHQPSTSSSTGQTQSSASADGETLGGTH